jgi:hypothetical protein
MWSLAMACKTQKTELVRAQSLEFGPCVVDNKRHKIKAVMQRNETITQPEPPSLFHKLEQQQVHCRWSYLL